MKSGVYSISINGKKYIGSSIDINKRIKYHISRLKNNKHYNKHLQNAYNLHQNGVVVEILEKCNSDELLIKEKHYIDSYKTLDNRFGYNAAPNPFQGSRGVRWSQESKNKLSNSLISDYKSGKRRKLTFNHTQQAKTNISNNLIGNKCAKRCSIICHQNNVIYESLHAAARALDMSPSSVCDVLKGRKSSCKGYSFEYVEV